MSIVIGAGYMRVTDGAHVVFDSRDKLFHILTEKSGSASVGLMGWGGQGTPAYRNTNVDLGAVDANATHIIGAGKLTYSTGDTALPAGFWYMLGGSIVTDCKCFQSFSGTWATYVSSMAAFSTTVESGHAWFRERAAYQDGYESQTAHRSNAYTLQYKLWAGTFT